MDSFLSEGQEAPEVVNSPNEVTAFKICETLQATETVAGPALPHTATVGLIFLEMTDGHSATNRRFQKMATKATPVSLFMAQAEPF